MAYSSGPRPGRDIIPHVGGGFGVFSRQVREKRREDHKCRRDCGKKSRQAWRGAPHGATALMTVPCLVDSMISEPPISSSRSRMPVIPIPIPVLRD